MKLGPESNPQPPAQDSGGDETRCRKRSCFRQDQPHNNNSIYFLWLPNGQRSVDPCTIFCPSGIKSGCQRWWRRPARTCTWGTWWWCWTAAGSRATTSSRTSTCPSRSNSVICFRQIVTQSWSNLRKWPFHFIEHALFLLHLLKNDVPCYNITWFVPCRHLLY